MAAIDDEGVAAAVSYHSAPFISQQVEFADVGVQLVAAERPCSEGASRGLGLLPW